MLRYFNIYLKISAIFADALRKGSASLAEVKTSCLSACKPLECKWC